MNPQRIGTVGVLALLVLVPQKTLSAEVRTIQEYGASPASWSETLVTKAEADGGRTLQTRRSNAGSVSTQGPSLLRLSRFDSGGRLISLTITDGDGTFHAERSGARVMVTQGDKRFSIDLRGRDWIDTQEQAAKVLLASKKGKMEFLFIPQNQPDMHLVLAITKAGIVQRKGSTVIEFSIVATGVQALFVPKMTVWLSPEGQLIAQETLPTPPSGPPPEPGKEKAKPEGGLRVVLQEMTGSTP